MNRTGDQASTLPVGAWLAIIGGVLIAVGALLPWLTASILIAGTYNRNAFQLGANRGFSIDGPILLALGVASVIIGVARLTGAGLPKGMQRSPIVTGIAAAAVVVIDIPSLNHLASGINSASPLDSASLGYGLWVVAGGALLAVCGGLVLRSARQPIPFGGSGMAQMAATGLQAAGWHPDPTGRYPKRWWDGQRWTERVVGAGGEYRDPI